MLLCMPEIILESAEKLAAIGTAADATANFLAAVALACEWVRIDFFHCRGERVPKVGLNRR